MSETLEFERAQLQLAYEAAEERVTKLRKQLDDGVQAVHNFAAQNAASSLRDTVSSLTDALSPEAGILLKGKVTLDQTDAAGDLAGETYYVAIAALGVISQPQVMSWESKSADAFRDPASWRDGASVRDKSIFVGGYRRLDLVQRVRTQGDGAGLPEDEALTSILLERSGSELSEVVATIQRSQFKLMELPPNETLIVQGGPGTGKTIIGLHRVSVLLYRYAEELGSRDVLVVTPTDTLARYVRNVLPGLGRGAVRVASMGALERHGAGTPVPEPGDLEAARDAEQVKGLQSMVQVLEREVDSLTRVPKGGLNFGMSSITEAEVAAVIQKAKARSGSYATIRARIHAALAEHLGVEEARDRQATTALFDQVAPDRSPRQLVAELLSSGKRLAASGQGILTPAQQAAIKRRRTNVRDVAWTLADLPLLDAADALLNGPLRQDEQFTHIVVDEAQDLSPMQLRMLVRRCAENGAFTILGDLAQATKGWANDSWPLHLRAGGIDVDDGDIRPLTAGYRVPAVQMDYANQLLPVMDIQTPPTTSILTTDSPPRIEKYDSDEEVVSAAIVSLRQLLDERTPGHSIGVIGLEELLDQLQVELEPAGVPSQWADTSQDGHVTLVTADDAKGLEFDHVLVLRPEQIYRLDPVSGPRTLYVALTRARRSLSLAHVDTLPSALTGLEEAPASSRTPPTDSATVPPPAPTDPSSALRCMAPFRGGFVLVEWVVHGPASITWFPASGGSPEPVADGFTAGVALDLHWAIRTVTGQGLSVRTTSAVPDEVASEIVAALDAAG